MCLTGQNQAQRREGLLGRRSSCEKHHHVRPGGEQQMEPVTLNPSRALRIPILWRRVADSRFLLPATQIHGRFLNIEHCSCLCMLWGKYCIDVNVVRLQLLKTSTLKKKLFVLGYFSFFGYVKYIVRTFKISRYINKLGLFNFVFSVAHGMKGYSEEAFSEEMQYKQTLCSFITHTVILFTMSQHIQ